MRHVVSFVAGAILTAVLVFGAAIAGESTWQAPHPGPTAIVAPQYSDTHPNAVPIPDVTNDPAPELTGKVIPVRQGWRLVAEE